MAAVSTQTGHKTETCSQCHPVYTGKRKPLSCEGRISRFNRRYGINT